MPNTLKVLVVQEQGYWVAIGLEHDIVAQTKKLDDLEYELLRTLAMTEILRERHCTDGIHGISPAPKQYWKLWEASPFDLKSRCNELEPFVWQVENIDKLIIPPTCHMRLADSPYMQGEAR